MASTESVGGHGWPGMDATTVATYLQMQSITMHHQEVEPLSSDHVHVIVCICAISVYSYLAPVRYIVHTHAWTSPHPSNWPSPSYSPPTSELLDSVFTLSMHELRKEPTSLHTTHGCWYTCTYMHAWVDSYQVQLCFRVISATSYSLVCLHRREVLGGNGNGQLSNGLAL